VTPQELVDLEPDGVLPGPDETEDDDDGAAHGDGVGDDEDLERDVVSLKGDAGGLVIAAGHGEGGGEGNCRDKCGGEQVGLYDTVEVLAVEGPESAVGSGRQHPLVAPFGLLLLELIPEMHLVGVHHAGSPLFLEDAARRLAVVVADARVDALVVEQQQPAMDTAHPGGEVQIEVCCRWHRSS